MDTYYPSLEWFSQLPFDMNSTAETSGYCFDNMFPNQAQIEQEAIAQVNAEIPLRDANNFNCPELHTTLPGPLPAGIESWSGVAAHAPQFPQAAVEPYTNCGFVQQSIPTQQPAVLHQFSAPQQPVAPCQLGFPQQFTVPQQLLVPQQFGVPPLTMTPGQFIPFQQHFIHDQPAPQTVATAPLAAPAAPAIPIDSAAPTFLDASAAPQAVAASPTVLSSEPLPSNVSAVHVFEANVVFNNECRSAGLHTWNEIENDITNHRPTESPIQLVANWEEPLLYMSKQDFRAYYYKQHKLARACKMALPQLPGWVSEFAFSEKDLAKHSPLPTDRAAAQAILKRSLRGSASSKPEVGSKSKGKGKARATPYTRTGSSLRPSTLGRS